LEKLWFRDWLLLIISLLIGATFLKYLANRAFRFVRLFATLEDFKYSFIYCLSFSIGGSCLVFLMSDAVFLFNNWSLFPSPFFIWLNKYFFLLITLDFSDMPCWRDSIFSFGSPMFQEFPAISSYMTYEVGD
jgi:hypothetical protein